MSKAAIAIDDHKEKLFKNGLTAAGYEYTEGEYGGVMMLYVETDDMIKLGDLVYKLNEQARKNKMN